jgi:hypothetical protein
MKNRFNITTGVKIMNRTSEERVGDRIIGIMNMILKTKIARSTELFPIIRVSLLATQNEHSIRYAVAPRR